MLDPCPSPAAAGLPSPAGAHARLQTLRARPRGAGEASFFWYEAEFGREAVKVLPGEYAAHDRELLIVTVLGSCIACCLWDRDARVGGMNHFMLPDGGGAGGRYGRFAMDRLIDELVGLGARRRALQAKVFGGARLLTGTQGTGVGARNARFALEYLRAAHIPVLSQDVQGSSARKLAFLPVSGRALVKRLGAVHRGALLAQERAAAQTAQRLGRRS